MPKELAYRTFTSSSSSSNISLFTQAQELLCLSIKPTGTTSFVTILAPQTPHCHRNLEIHSNPILGYLVKGRCHSKVSPVNTCIARTMPKHHSQRCNTFRIIRTTRAPMHAIRTHILASAAQMAGRVTC